MTARITPGASAPPYDPPLHEGVAARRLQGVEAGPTEHFWVGLSDYSPRGAATTSPTAEETVYVVLDGEFTLSLPDEDRTEVLRANDSVHLPKGTLRSVANTGTGNSRLLVVIATPR